MKRIVTGIKRAKAFVSRQVAPLGTLALVGLPRLAMAMDGADTAGSSLSSLKAWLMTWIPIACVIGLIISALAWIFHMLRLDWAVRLCVGMIAIGSASYIVGWFGLSA